MRFFARLLMSLSAIFMISVVSSAQKKIVFTPQWTAQSQFAGYYVALEKGFYKEAGLDVTIVHPSASNSAINQLKNRTSDFVTMQLQQALIEIDNGLKLVNILQTMQNSGLLIMPRHEKISSMNDLKGKRVGIWKVGFGDYALMVDKEHNLEIEWIPFVQNINLFISGVIDATLAMSYNEILQIRAAGYDISTAISIADEGYDFPEDGLYVSEDYFRNNPQTVKAFADASRKGWEWAQEHPEETLEIVMEKTHSNNIATNRTHQKWMLEEVLKLNKDTEIGTATYTLKSDQVRRLSDLLVKHGMISKPVTYETITGQTL